MENFWNIVWTTFLIFAFTAYLIILFTVIADIFRDRSMNGWLKAVWILFLIWVPFITALVYLIVQGKGMAERQQQLAERNKQATDTYIRETAGASPSAEIAQAKALLDSGAISSAEYASLKDKALSSQ